MTSDVDLRKQWLGYFLLSTTLDIHATAVVPQAGSPEISKHLNHYLAQILLTLGKNDLLSDQACMAVKAWTALVQFIHATYDNKVHASVLTQHKQVMQVVFKKVEKSLKSLSPSLSVDERV